MQATTPSREIKVTPVFQANWEALLHSGKRYICNEGGTRSGKTFSIVQVLICYAENFKNKRITICSHSLPHLKRGAMRDFDTIIKDWGRYNESRHNKTDNMYEFSTGSYIEFIGLEDHEKARGAGRDILFVNEANLISKALFDQLDMRTTQTVITDLNPADFDSWCYHVADSPEAFKIHSTYRNNITNLPKKQVEVIESYKDADPIMWQVFGLGLRGTSQEQIYTHWKIVDELPGKGNRFYGLDFGYNVPSALVAVEEYEGANYCEEWLYQTKLTTGDLVERLKALSLKPSDIIYCDNAEPKTIEELSRAGFNARKAEKDVWAGIQKVKSMPLFVTRRSKNLINELKSYKWKLDKDGKIHPDEEPDKVNDHAADAMRYAIFTHGTAFKFKVVVA